MSVVLTSTFGVVCVSLPLSGWLLCRPQSVYYLWVYKTSKMHTFNTIDVREYNVEGQ